MVFVTGGTGMVGAHLLYDLVIKGEKVRALKRPGSSILRTEKIFACYSVEYHALMQNIEWVEGDILEKESLRELLAGVDWIYHVAAIVSFDPRDRDTMIHNNCEGTSNLIDLALSMKIPRFCHVSSIAAIGSPPEGIEANEDHPWRNTRDHSAYSESKYLSEMEVWRGILQGLDAVIVNPSVILGPGDGKTGSSQLFKTIWKGLRFYTKGGTGFVDVRDVVTVMQRLMNDDVWESVKNKRYILSAGNRTYRDIFDKISYSFNVKRPQFFASDALLKLAWRLSALKSTITGSRPSITRETAGSANKLSYYDGSGICHAIPFEYTPIEDSIRNNARLFLRDFSL
jgi:nucleoside-diphosphate-sugar epimerase